MRDAIYGGWNFTDSLSEEIETASAYQLLINCAVKRVGV
jgi:hypothetical protein